MKTFTEALFEAIKVANQQMLNDKRMKWSISDYNLYVRTLNTYYPDPLLKEIIA